MVSQLKACHTETEERLSLKIQSLGSDITKNQQQIAQLSEKLKFAEEFSNIDFSRVDMSKVVTKEDLEESAKNITRSVSNLLETIQLTNRSVISDMIAMDPINKQTIEYSKIISMNV